MQLRMSTRAVEGVLIVDCSGRLVFGEESANLRDMVKKLLAPEPECCNESPRSELHR